MKPSSLLPVIFAIGTFTSPLPPSDANEVTRLDDRSTELDERQFEFRDTRNELGECKPVTVLFARGTIELGNVGTITGPPFFNALDQKLGAENVAVQGVDYPADFVGYFEGGDKGGAAKLASLTEQAASQCPDTEIILSGYSQGAQVVHLGEAQLSPETAARVAAIVVFGDPDKGKAFPNIDASRVKTYCFSTDLICEHLPVVDTYHFSYAVDAGPAADFVSRLVHV